MRKRNLRNAAMAFALASAVGLGACGDDDPVGIDDENVERIQLVLNSEIMAEYDGTSWGGALNVTEGTSTDHFDVRLTDHDGDVVSAPSGIHLQVDIANQEVALWEQDTAGELGGHLHGVAAGETEAVFKLMRGTQEEYVTTAVRVDVNTP
jgi:hypothetical protein